MYQPAHGRFTVEEPAGLLADLAAVSPATLVTHGPAGFTTSILPMLFSAADGDLGTLRGHLARPNPQWAAAAEGSAAAVAIFHGPDAYVSPGWYAEKARTGRVVPTWNYVVVAAHGTLARPRRRGVAARPRPRSRRSPRGGPPGTVVDRRRARWLHPGPIEGHRRPGAPIDRIEAKRKLSQNSLGCRCRRHRRGARPRHADGARGGRGDADPRWARATLPPSRR